VSIGISNRFTVGYHALLWHCRVLDVFKTCENSQKNVGFPQKHLLMHTIKRFES
jgi:hypothetical protein